MTFDHQSGRNDQVVWKEYVVGYLTPYGGDATHQLTHTHDFSSTAYQMPPPTIIWRAKLQKLCQFTTPCNATSSEPLRKILPLHRQPRDWLSLFLSCISNHPLRCFILSSEAQSGVLAFQNQGPEPHTALPINAVLSSPGKRRVATTTKLRTPSTQIRHTQRNN